MVLRTWRPGWESPDTPRWLTGSACLVPFGQRAVGTPTPLGALREFSPCNASKLSRSTLKPPNGGLLFVERKTRRSGLPSVGVLRWEGGVGSTTPPRLVIVTESLDDFRDIFDANTE